MLLVLKRPHLLGSGLRWATSLTSSPMNHLCAPLSSPQPCPNSSLLGSTVSPQFLRLNSYTNSTAFLLVSALPAALSTLDPSRRAVQLRSHIAAFQSSISAIERCPYPVIAATHGLAIGLSIDIISACDIRYTASNAMFSIKVSPSLPLPLPPNHVTYNTFRNRKSMSASPPASARSRACQR